MAIDVKDLPPAYQAQALRKYMEQERNGRTGKEAGNPGAAGGGGREKPGNQDKTILDETQDDEGAFRD